MEHRHEAGHATRHGRGAAEGADADLRTDQGPLARSRARVEYPFHVIKNLFGYRKVSYRGIAKNEARAKAHAALANLYIARRRLMAQGVSASAA